MTTPLMPYLKTPTSFDLRSQLDTMVIKDLLGSAGGPEEEVDERSICQRYLTGMLAPSQSAAATPG